MCLTMTERFYAAKWTGTTTWSMIVQIKYMEMHDGVSISLSCALGFLRKYTENGPKNL